MRAEGARLLRDARRADGAIDGFVQTVESRRRPDAGPERLGSAPGTETAHPGDIKIER